MTVASILLRWYRQHGRRLPWRGTRDPYRILVSEIMLQQTQVDRVVEFYPRWLKRFPTWQKLAEGTSADVIRAWAGLGYNRRALMLRDIAREVIDHGVPRSESAWLALKGVGSYTAAAVSAFAAHERTVPIDTNVRRVLGRLLLGRPFPTPRDDNRIRGAADHFLPRRGAHWDVPQALFDLSTMVCKKTPTCAVCPLGTQCKSAKLFLEGRVAIPRRATPAPHERRHRNKPFKPFPDRIYRGRILKLVREWGQVRLPAKALAAAGLPTIGSLVDPQFDRAFDSTWLSSMVFRLVHDGLLRRAGNSLTLPE